MTNEVWTAALGLGFALGLRHALDPDHVVAVSTIVSESRSIRRSSLVGTCWGLGHTAALLAAGVAVIGLKLSIPRQAALWMESAVAAMLVLLGLKAVRTAFLGWKVHRHVHVHGGHEHAHFHVHGAGEHAHSHRHLLGFRTQPFLVGLVHGLAGSAGLMILVLGTIPSAIAGLTYIAVFGLGSTGGMLLMSSLISLPFVWTARRFALFTQGLQLLVGFGSILFGCFLAWQYGFHPPALPH